MSAYVNRAGLGTERRALGGGIHPEAPDIAALYGLADGHKRGDIGILCRQGLEQVGGLFEIMIRRVGGRKVLDIDPEILGKRYLGGRQYAFGRQGGQQVRAHRAGNLVPLYLHYIHAGFQEPGALGGVGGVNGDPEAVIRGGLAVYGGGGRRHLQTPVVFVGKPVQDAVARKPAGGACLPG